ncbi:MAG: hypothetical protein GQ570_11910 [Helicobacteraceae bacterium]|nr:hypothetical protein [Helicobacteraceae bacterium]
MIYLTMEQKREVMSQCKETGLVLLEYYLSKAGTPNFEYTDEKSAIALGWDISKVSRVRRILEKEDLYKRELFSSKSGNGSTVFTIAERYIKG